MKKLLLLIPLLFPVITSAQFVGRQIPPYNNSLIIAIISAIVFLVYIMRNSKMQNIKDFFKSFIDKEVMFVSIFSASLFVFLFTLAKYIIGNQRGLTASSMGVVDYLYADYNSLFYWVMTGVGSIIFLLIPPFYFVFTRGWRHFIACFFDMTLLVIIISLLVQIM